MFKSASFTFIAKIVTAGCNFATVIMLSRYLGAASKGICAWYLVIIAVSLVFSEIATGPATGFLLQKYPVNKIKVLGYIWSFLTAGLTTTFFFILGKINMTEWGLLLLLCWLNAANTTNLTLLLARQQFIFFNGLNMFLAAGVLATVCVFFSVGYANTQGYLYSLLMIWGTSFLIGAQVKDRRSPVNLDKKYSNLLKDCFRYGLANQASHLAGLLNSRLVYFLLPATALGIYSNAMSLSEAMLMLPSSLGQVLYAQLLNGNSAHTSGSKTKTIWWICLLLLGMAFLFILVIPDELYQTVFGNDFVGVKSYLSVLTAGTAFNGCYLILSYWQSANGRFIKNFYATLVGLCLNAAFCIPIFFMGNFSPLLAAFAISVGFVGVFLVSAIQFCNLNGGLKSLFWPPRLSEIVHFFK